MSFKSRGQVFVKFHNITNCTITSLYYSDGISATTNPTILLAAYRVLGLVLVLTIRTEPLIKTDTNTNPRIGIGIGSTIRTDLTVSNIKKTVFFA